VDGLHIEIKKGRFLYNNPFNVSFKNHSTDFKAQQLKIDLFWWQCDGLCIENVSARSIKLALGNAPEATQQSNQEPLAKITFPFNIAVKNVAINEFVLNHPSADVTVNNFTLAAKAEDATLAVKSLTISDVLVKLKEQPASSNQATANQGQALPALPDIEFMHIFRSGLCSSFLFNLSFCFIFHNQILQYLSFPIILVFQNFLFGLPY